MRTLHIIIPTYNESATLGRVLEAIGRAPLGPGWNRRVVIVDDGSTDASPAILDDIATADHVSVIRHERNRGKGAALRTGFAHVLNNEWSAEDVVLIQDADLEYDPTDHAAILRPFVEGRSNVVYGTRFGGHYRPTRKRARLHAWGNRLLTMISNVRTGYALTDMECCYKAMTPMVLKRIAGLLQENSFGIEPEVTAALASIEEPIVEVPVSYEPRSTSEGKKIKWRDGYHALRVISKAPARMRGEPVTVRPWRKTAVQAVGFLVGLGLLGWCIGLAVQNDQFSKLRHADPGMVGLLTGCTVVSVLANGTIFWVLIRPVRRLPWLDIQLVNSVVNLLNYAPIRLGVITRLAHHRRVDHLSFGVLIAWYAAFALLMFAVLGCIVLATLIRPQVDAIWLLVLVTILLVTVVVVRQVAKHRFMADRFAGAATMLRYWPAVGAAVGLRLIDVAAYTARLYLALTMLGHTVTVHDAVFLSIISMIASLSPVAALGFREFAVAMLGPLLTDAGLVDSIYAAVVVDRAGEAVVFIPLGVISLIWMVRRWMSVGQSRAMEPGVA